MSASYHFSGRHNIGIGREVMKSPSSSVTDNTGRYNTAVGDRAMKCLTSGCGNVFLGTNAARDLTTGGCNIGIGYHAMMDCARCNLVAIKSKENVHNFLKELVDAIDMVPFEKLSFSKYPAGPFHKTVLEILIFF